MQKFVLLLSVIFITACSSAPTRAPQEAAIFHALTQDSALRQIATHCGSLSQTLKNRSWQTQQSWWKRNGTFVEAAEFGFSYHLISITGDRQVSGARYAMALAMDVSFEAENVASSVVQASDRKLACESALSEYNEGKMDLNKNRDLYKSLLSLDQQKGRHGKDLLVEQARVSTKTGERYSRSSVTAERLVIRQVCAKPKIKTLKASWPSEIFEATCPDKSAVLISCHWGNCDIRN
ncbi:MAG: hypothetical protein JKX83_02115 [Pseudomonadales bacterium]|nr:hypothetical protein [Pseudomonadales bacterium]